MRGVIYARYSSTEQREESIEGQIRECKSFAEGKGITVIGSFIDRALSAKTDAKPDFQRMVITHILSDSYGFKRRDAIYICKGFMLNNSPMSFPSSLGKKLNHLPNIGKIEPDDVPVQYHFADI